MLDKIEKILRIIFTIILGTVVSVAGVSIQWNRFGMETDDLCFKHFKTVYEAVVLQETLSQTLVARYADRCEVPLDQAASELQALKANAEQAADAAMRGAGMSLPWSADADDPRIVGNGIENVEPTDQDFGFVALGRMRTDVYSQVNFDTLDGLPATGDGTAPAIGTRLQARWEVNLRSNTEVTTGGGNPITGMISTGQCVEIIAEPVELRGQFWAQVNRIGC